MNLTFMLAGLVAVLLATAGAYWQGRGDGAAITQGQIDKQSVAVSLAVESAASATAGVIAKIRVQHTTIRQEVEREIRENVVYRDCQHSPVQLQRINAALTGAGPEPAGGGKLPPTDAPDRPVIRRDDFEAD